MKVDDAIITEHNTVAEILVDYFATIADDIGGNMAKRHSIDDFIGHPSVSRITTEHFFNDETISIKPVTNSEVYNVLHLLNTRKATGYDAIPAKHLQFGANELAKPLTNLYNFCIRNGKWPQNRKRGEWHPIFKNEDPQQKSNYRPITVLPAVDKVFEQLVGKQLTKQTDHLLNHCITAYRKSHSCETILVCLIENWKLAKDNHRNVAILSTDMSKAFDSLHPPPLMLSKLRAYGCNENALELLCSYLGDRSNRVKMGSTKSTWKLVNRGCPQGSALGPLLWNIFQNDLTYDIPS